MAAWEREEIAARVAASVPIRAKLGKRVSGAAPFGYAWIDGKLVPDEKGAPVRKLMYELFRETKQVRTVAGMLNARGFRTRRGKKFTQTSVYRLILDPTAKGLRRANYSRSLGDGKKWVWKPQSEWVELPIPAIVDVALWDECTAILKERRENRRPGFRPVHLFTGVTFCTCGTKMYVPSNTPKLVCNGCRNKIATADLERVFIEQLRGFVFSADEVAYHLSDVDATVKGKTELLASLERERAGESGRTS